MYCQIAANFRHSSMSSQPLLKRGIAIAALALFCLASISDGGRVDPSAAKSPASKPSRGAAIALAAGSLGGCGHRPGDKKGELFAHIYGLEGQIVRINKTSTTLRSVSVKVTRNLPTALGSQPYDDRLGAIAVIHFDEALDHFSNLPLAKGAVVRIYYGQIVTDDDSTACIWGSSSVGIAVKNRGAFYDKDGKKVDENQLLEAGRP